MAKQTLEWSPQDGLQTAKPRRSWRKGERAVGTYEASFEYDGSTIFINGLGQAEWAEFEAAEKKLYTANQAFQDEVSARVEAEKAKIAARASSKTRLSPEQLEAERVAETEVADGWKARKAQLDNEQLEVLSKIVTLSVVGWEGAPVPFSSDALAELPPEIVTDWAGIIVEKSRLSASEARFLAPKS